MIKTSKIVHAAISLVLVFNPVTLRADFSPEDIVAAVVELRSEVPANARTAGILGTERIGNGVFIDDDGLILTIGYLIMESSSVVVTDQAGNTSTASVVAYDHNSGFGLLRADKSLDRKPLELGDSSNLNVGDPVLVVTQSGELGMSPARVVSRRTFVGSWEYLLDEAIFTAPPNRNFGGAALVNGEGKLVGIGSLIVQDAETEDSPDTPGNMFVPVDKLTGILDSLVKTGNSGSATPWLGVYTEMHRGHLFVTRIADESPASDANIKRGDIVLKVGKANVATMADFVREIWTQGEAGVDVDLTTLRDGKIETITIRSVDRNDWLKLNPKQNPGGKQVT